MKKKELLQTIEDALSIIQDNNALDEALAAQFKKSIDTLSNFSAKILVVGGFSAGKSAMLNSFLGNEEILPENISPETAIATELKFGSEEKVLRVKVDGDIVACSFADVREKSAEGYAKYIYVLDRPQLQNLGDLALVDMPGFDSGIEAHNRALMQYLSEAAAYVFVIDMTRGTVGQSSLDFLREVRKYSRSVSFVLTKSDKLTSENIAAVKDEIGAVLESVWPEQAPLLVMSIREKNVSEKLAQLFSKFSADDLLMQKHGGNVLFLLQQALNGLETQLKALDFDPRDIDIAIRRQEEQRDAILNKLKKEEHRMREDMRINVPARILGDVETALRNHIAVLVRSAMQGNEAFNSTVNNILRPVLLQSTEHHIETSFNDYIGSIADFSDNQGINATEVADKLRKTVASIETITKFGKAFAKAQKYRQLYKLFTTGAALTTSVIGPLLELIIIFLPEILDGINKIFGSSREEKLQRHIEHNAIPLICDKLRPEIQNAMLEVEEQQITTLNENFQTILDNEISTLENLKQEKEGQRLNITEKREKLVQGINTIKNLIVNVEYNVS